MPEITAGDGVPFREAIEHFRGKLNITTKRWDEILGETHARAFTVASATKLDLLKDLRQSAEQAISQGTNITEFRKGFDKAVQDHGWDYKGKRGWRTRTIYDTNLRTAHMAGRWDQIQRTKDSRPYIQYQTVGDNRVRPEHQAWDNIVLPIDDPWWNTHYPPNGWGCRCTVRTLSDRQLQREKLKVDKAPSIKKTERINTKTGEIYGDVPVGIDTGWDYNVGKAWLAPETSFGEKVMLMPPSLRDSALVSIARSLAPQTSKSFRTWAENILATTDAGSYQPTGYLKPTVIDFLTDRDYEVTNALIVTHDRRLRRMRRPSKLNAGKALTHEDVISLADHIDSPKATLWDKRDKSVVFVFDTTDDSDPRKGKALVKINITKKGVVRNEVWSAGLVSEVNLTDTNQYILIDGKL